MTFKCRSSRCRRTLANGPSYAALAELGQDRQSEFVIQPRAGTVAHGQDNDLVELDNDRVVHEVPVSTDEFPDVLRCLALPGARKLERNLERV